MLPAVNSEKVPISENVFNKDFQILKRTMDFALDVNQLLNTIQLNTLNNSESRLVHEIAGPPYFENDPQLPNMMGTTKRPKLRKKKKPSTTFRKNNNTNKIKKKPTTNVKSKLQQIKLRKLRRQKLRAKIMKQLQTIDDKNKILRKNAGGSSPNRRIFNNSDLSLSRKDFLRELTTWFRRSIWFLIFAGAYTTSPTLLGLAFAFGIAFELALNMDVASDYMNEFAYDWNRRTTPLLENPIETLKIMLGMQDPSFNPMNQYYNYQNVYTNYYQK